MAILNFAKTYLEISLYLTLSESNKGDFIKLFFSKDGHIISHGKDYTPNFSVQERGLVNPSHNLVSEFLRGNNTWATITTTDLPIANSIEEAIALLITNTTILTTLLILDYVGNSFAANDAMRYKGTISYTTSTGYEVKTKEGIKLGFPAPCEVGDTYRIITKGIYAGMTGAEGDLLICILDAKSDTNKIAYWTIVEANINGSVNHTINGAIYSVYTKNTSDSFTIYAPSTGGSEGWVLQSKGDSEPIWKDPRTLIAGEAIKVSNPLTMGIGLRFLNGDNYDGSAARSINLTAATRTTLGGVIVDKNNDKKTISVDSDGNIYLTKENVVNALKYDPATTDTWRPIFISNNDIELKSLNFMPSNTIHIKLITQEDRPNEIGMSFDLCWYNISTKEYEYI